MTMTVKDLIKKRGGPDEIAAASQETTARITSGAVHKWRKIGIPEIHWPIFISVGFTVEQIYAANELLRQEKNGRCEAVQKKQPSRLVA